MISRLQERLGRFGWSIADLLDRDAPGGLGVPGVISSNGCCRLVRCRDGWIALNLSRPDDWDLVPALTNNGGNGWSSIVSWACGQDVEEVLHRGVELHLPLSVVGEAEPQTLPPSDGDYVPRKVVDLSALWAGPLCAALLRLSGAQVVRILSVGRPDPTPNASPQLDRRINSGKTLLALDLRTQQGREALLREVADADVLVTSARPAALMRLGLGIRGIVPPRWVAISAHGFAGRGGCRVGFGDDCAAAGGLLTWRGDQPLFRGDALADPLTGLEGALAVLSGATGLIDMAMSRVAAAYAR
ncbi:CoA transferase [Sphingobium sp. DEHP117]|uniref:CoA transferase n=1 Tax=Sphingobium sp. DEHP117 TaxID=2993436 RepID=UPI0027D72ED0|nr:CoA transferase [Sphingobium sp. DEHP117]MDQ4421801.1 CoA transferase [Sphingobium sp. DEHP117]